MYNSKFSFVLTLLLLQFSFVTKSQEYGNGINKNIDTTENQRFATRKISQVSIIRNELLILYSDSSDYESVNYLLGLGADPNYSNADGVTALMYAADNGSYKIVQRLIEMGADVNLKPYDGNTAIFAAVRANNDSIAELLIRSKADINLQNYLDLTPLHYAAGLGYPAMTDLLIYYGAKLDNTDSEGNTPLMASVYSGASIASELLIKAGADVNKSDIYGNTPLMVAAQFNDTTLIRMLFNAGAFINSVNSKKNNAFAFAVKNSSIEALKMLLSFGVNSDDSGLEKSYYQQAVESGSIELISFLKSRGFTTKLNPNISSINFYYGFSTSSYDFMVDFGGGIYEPITKMLVNVGYKYRPFSCRVVEYRNSEFYQLWEKRYAFYISIQRLMAIKKSYHSYSFGIIPGLSNELTWSYYRGVDKGSGAKWIVAPSVGLFYQKNFFTAIGKWEIANYNKQVNNFNRFNLQLLLSIPTFRSSLKDKKIDWLE